MFTTVAWFSLCPLKKPMVMKSTVVVLSIEQKLITVSRTQLIQLQEL